LRLLEDPLHPGNQMQIDRLVVAPDGLTYDRDTLVELHPRLRGSLFPNLVAQRVFRERLEQCKE
ncbi:MAG: hypothetical protein KDK78_04835, partial [Chlamydiia bacterium]|nr:hypothetical protein [Chlamydiia bacterium]